MPQTKSETRQAVSRFYERLCASVEFYPYGPDGQRGLWKVVSAGQSFSLRRRRFERLSLPRQSFESGWLPRLLASSPALAAELARQL